MAQRDVRTRRAGDAVEAQRRHACGVGAEVDDDTPGALAGAHARAGASTDGLDAREPRPRPSPRGLRPRSRSRAPSPRRRRRPAPPSRPLAARVVRLAVGPSRRRSLAAARHAPSPVCASTAPPHASAAPRARGRARRRPAAAGAEPGERSVSRQPWPSSTAITAWRAVARAERAADVERAVPDRAKGALSFISTRARARARGRDVQHAALVRRPARGRELRVVRELAAAEPHAPKERGDVERARAGAEAGRRASSRR